jgi:hypothetical protein
MEDFDGALSFIDAELFDESIAFGSVGVFVVNHFYGAHRADTFEEFFEVGFGGLVGQIAEVKPSGLDIANGSGLALARWTRLTWFTGCFFANIARITARLSLWWGVGFVGCGAGLGTGFLCLGSG